MKYFVGIVFLALCASVQGELKCSLPVPAINTDWIDMATNCVEAVRNQIQREVNASFVYLSMAAYFSKDTVNRPGFAEHFFESAKEERQHAKTLIEYLSMRGELANAVTNLIVIPPVETQSWESGAAALSEALKLEASVTKSIRSVISKCEKNKFNDYHLVDYLTGVYLEEQYKGQRDLAGKLSTLEKMMVTHGLLGEFLFDKTLLK